MHGTGRAKIPTDLKIKEETIMTKIRFDYTKAGKYHEIDGTGTIEEVRDRIFDVMDKF